MIKKSELKICLLYLNYNSNVKFRKSTNLD